MATGNEFGITSSQPYGGWSYYISTANTTENPKYSKIQTALFPRLRMISSYGYGGAGTTYPNNSTLSIQNWASYLKTNYPSTYLLYGVTNNLQGFTPDVYEAYSTYLQEEAAWAEANLMDCFCMGNENLISAAHSSAGMTPTSITRASNVATATFSSAHGLTTGDYIFVSGGSDASYRVSDSTSGETVQCTVTSPTVITYPSTGSDGTATGSYKVNWSAYEVVRKTKALATIVQGIFTRGPVQYTESQGWETAWINLGKGDDIDLWGINAYGTGNNESNFTTWKATIDSCFAAFGSSLIVTELNCVVDSGNVIIGNFNHEQMGAEEVFDREIIRRYEYLQSLDISQIYLYGTSEYGFFANTWPITTSTNAYITGSYKPIIKKLRGERVSEAFFGLNTST